MVKEINHCPIQRSPDGDSKPGHGWGVRAAILDQAWVGSGYHNYQDLEMKAGRRLLKTLIPASQLMSIVSLTESGLTQELRHTPEELSKFA